LAWLLRPAHVVSGHSATDLREANVRRTARRTGGGDAVSSLTPLIGDPGSNAHSVAANGDVEETASAIARYWPDKAAPSTSKRTGHSVPGTRSHERRWRNASIFFVERRRGDFYKYGSIVLCVALWLQVWLLYRM